MTENEQTQAPSPTGAGPQELDPKQIEQLSELVYRLLQKELITARERRGESWGRKWR